MPSRALRSTEHRIQVLLTLVKESQAHCGRLATEHGWPEESDFDGNYRLTHAAALEAATHLVAQLALEHLNVAVDSALSVAVSQIREDDDPTTVKDLSRSRKEHIDLLERYATCKFDTLTGWSEVDALRLDVNALKHRGGVGQVVPHEIELGDGDSLRWSELIGVDTSAAIVEQRAHGVLAWLEALTERLMNEKHTRRDARRAALANRV